jgi:hypothetical protein
MTMPDDERQEYIGDGVYASFDGYTVWLHTDRAGGRHWLALEPEVMRSLNDFYTRRLQELGFTATTSGDTA